MKAKYLIFMMMVGSIGAITSAQAGSIENMERELLLPWRKFLIRQCPHRNDGSAQALPKDGWQTWNGLH